MWRKGFVGERDGCCWCDIRYVTMCPNTLCRYIALYIDERYRCMQCYTFLTPVSHVVSNFDECSEVSDSWSRFWAHHICSHVLSLTFHQNKFTGCRWAGSRVAIEAPFSVSACFSSWSRFSLTFFQNNLFFLGPIQWWIMTLALENILLKDKTLILSFEERNST